MTSYVDDPETLLAALAAHPPAALVEVDAEGRIHRWGPGAEELFGWPADAVRGGTGPLEREDCWVEDRIRGRPGAPAEGTVTRADGSTAEVRLRVVPLTGSGSAPERTLCLFRPLRSGEEEPAAEDPPSACCRVPRDCERSGCPDRELADAIRLIPVPIFLQGPSGRLRAANPAAVSFFGLAPEEVTGERPRALLPADRAEALEQAHRRVMETGETDRREVAIDVHGPPRVFEVTRVPLASGDGPPPGTLACARDVTERRRAERQRRDMMALLRDGRHLAVRCRLDGDVVDLNERARSWLLDPRSPGADDLSLRDLLPPTTSERLERELLPEVVRLGSWRGRLPVADEGGELLDLPAVVHADPLPDGDPAVRLILEIPAWDVVPEKELRRLREKYRALYTRTPAMLHSVNAENRIVEVSDRWLEKLGYDREEVIGRKPQSFLTEESRAFAEEVALPQFWEEPVGRMDDVPYQFETKDGGVLDVLLSTVAETDDDGEIVRTLTILKDVSEQRDAERRLREQKEWIEYVYRKTPAMLHWVDEQDRIVEVSDRWLENLGYDRDEVIGRRTNEFLTEESRRQAEAVGQPKFHEIGRAEDVHRRFRTREGEVRDVLVSSVAETDGDGAVVGAITALHDVTELRATRRRLRESEAKYRTLFSHANDAILLHEAEAPGRILDANRRAAELFGYERSELGDMTLLDLVPAHIAGDVREKIGVLSEQEEIEAEHLFETREGDWFTGQISAAVVEVGDRALVHGAVRDISDRKELEEELTHRALHDSLTGLPNRRHFERRLRRSMDRDGSSQRPVSLVFVDLDSFKEVNDSMGHQAGDALLQGVARRLESCMRASDFLAHFGGDEFVVIVEGCEEEDARQVARRLSSSFDSPFGVHGTEVRTTASLGVAVSRPGDRPDELLRCADVAMYEAKRRGRGLIHVFDRDRDHTRFQRLDRRERLRQAIEDDEFELHYQPVVSAETGRVRSLEALVRWRHPEEGLLSPGRFIPLAEETGLIVPLGRWILRRACQQTARWLEAGVGGPELCVSVNLSAAQLEDPDLPSVLSDVLQETGVSAELLELEITESVMMESTEHVGRLKEMGLRLVADDFGTGYSSLSYLHRFPVDLLKIDRRFVANVVEDPAICRAVVRLAEELGLETTGEGVETGAQLRELRELGVDFLQGYHFARPAPPERAAELYGGRAAAG